MAGQLKIRLEVYSLGADKDLQWYVVRYEWQRLSALGSYGGNSYLFEGPARELQAWAARRNIPYEHVTLNVPVELENFHG